MVGGRKGEIEWGDVRKRGLWGQGAVSTDAARDGLKARDVDVKACIVKVQG